MSSKPSDTPTEPAIKPTSLGKRGRLRGKPPHIPSEKVYVPDLPPPCEEDSYEPTIALYMVLAFALGITVSIPWN